MRRRGSIVALGAVLVAAALPSGAQAESKCQKLDAKHDLAPAARVELVERPNADGGKDLLGCLLPDGKVRTVAASSDQGTSIDKYKVVQVAGHHVLIRSSSSNQYGGGVVTYVFDVKRGRHYDVASTCHNLGDPCGPQTKAARALINSSGQAVAVVTSNRSDLVSVDGFSAGGTRKVLDTGMGGDIPPSSLELNGHLASWRNGGARKSARLPGIPDCEKLKADHDLAPAKAVKLVARKNDDGGRDLVGCVLPRGKVSVVATRSKISGQEQSYEVLQVAGHQVLVRGKLINPYGTGVSTYVFDLKRGTSYTVAESCFDEHGAACDQTYARRAFVNAKGQAATLIRTDGKTARQVVGFRSTGASEVLDTGTAAAIPASSLSLQGHVVHWTHSGAAKSATLSG
jgi:hypothetical protein